MGTQTGSTSIQDQVVEGKAGAGGESGQTSRYERVRAIAFKVVVVLSALFILAGFNLVFLMIVVSWLPAEMYLGIIGDPAVELLPHRMHDSINPVLAWSLLIGIVVQLRRPVQRQAPLLMVAAFPIVLTIVEVATGTFSFMENLPPYVIFSLLVLLHPRTRDLIRFQRMDRVMTALTVGAAAAWLPFAYAQMELQALGIAGDPHALKDHWSRMAIFAGLIVVWAFLGSSDRPGWRITAWVTGLASAWYGLQSIVFGGASAAALPWAIGAVVWGAAFIAAAERRARSSQEMTKASEGATAGRAVHA